MAQNQALKSLVTKTALAEWHLAEAGRAFSFALSALRRAKRTGADELTGYVRDIRWALETGVALSVGGRYLFIVSRGARAKKFLRSASRKQSCASVASPRKAHR